MKEFKNIPSKLYTHAENWVKNEKTATQEQIKSKRALSYKRPQSATIQKIKVPIQQVDKPKVPLDMDYHEDVKKNLGMFETYYYEKLKEKNLIEDYENEQEIKEEIKKEEEYKDNLRQYNNIVNIEDKLNEDYQNIKKAKLKEPTPTQDDIGILLPKSKKNYVTENKNLIHDKKIPLKNKKNDDIIEENPYHKDYGKTPEYIKARRIEAEVEKEIQKKKKEESKYPKGTRLLSEEERLATLNGLYESQKEIMGLIEKLPISLRTIASQNRKEELYRKLDEIEDAIKTFSRKQVFIKIDA